MKNHYTNSWELYKVHSESFKDDFEYYYNFCHGYKTLELFAGYGRLTNFLQSKGIDIESVELEAQFAKFINLPDKKNHVTDVLQFASNHPYERIIAGYNSFCLFLEDNQIKKFFEKANELLVDDGLLSLSYYPISAWKDYSQKINFKDMLINHTSKFDFSRISEDIATWIDEYFADDINHTFEYPTRVYKNTDDIIKFTAGTNLELFNIIENYNKNLEDPGWIEYVFIKRNNKERENIIKLLYNLAPNFQS